MEVTRGRQFVEFAYLLVRNPSCEIAHKDNFWFFFDFRGDPYREKKKDDRWWVSDAPRKSKPPEP